jgi:hypothetical protein
MTDHVTREVTAGLGRLGAGTPPAPDALAAGAVRGAARVRRARVAGTFVAVAVVIAVAVGVATAATPRRRSLPATPPTGGHLVVAGIGCTAFPGYSMLLDPDTGAYRKVPYCVEDVSPDGRRATVSEYVAAGREFRDGALTIATGQVVWFDDPYGRGVWSPDGRHVLMGADIDVASSGAWLADPDTGRVARISFGDLGDHQIDQVVWTPNGDLLATASCGCLPAALYGYDLGGHLVRSLPKAPRYPWPRGLYPGRVSPDGRYLVETSESTGEGFVTSILLDGAGARAVGHFGLRGYFVVGWYDATHLVVREGARSGKRPTELVVMDLGGHITSRLTRDVDSSSSSEQTLTTLFIATATDATGDKAF